MKEKTSGAERVFKAPQVSAPLALITTTLCYHFMRGEGKNLVLNSDSSQKLSMFRIVERKVIMNIKTTYTPD